MAITFAPLIPAKRQRARFRCAAMSVCLGIVTMSCGENTDKVIFQVPTTLTAALGGNTAGGHAAGGASSNIVSSGGVTTGGVASIGGAATGGAANGGSSTASTGPLMSAVGAPIGYAAVAGNNLVTTTGGGLRPADYVTNCQDLKSKLEDTSSPRVIVVDQPIDCVLPPAKAVPVQTCELSCDSTTNDPNRTIHRVLPTGATDCSSVSGGSSTTPLVSNYFRNETLINVVSNKTLLGQGINATISGATLYIKGQSNVIIQNLSLGEVNPSLLEAGDAITIDGSNHIWVDHCKFSYVSDGFVDAINTSNYITISWNHFDGGNGDACAGQHNYTNTIEGTTVTFHHNFYDHTLGCSPKVTKSSKAHIFNNYWLNVLYYSIQVATQTQALIQGNDFNTSKKPYYGSSSCLTDSTPCAISVPTPNQFEGISSTETQDTGGTVDPLPYDPSTCPIDAVGIVKAEVLAGAGATLPL